MKIKKEKIQCPICQKPNTFRSDNPNRPFCSDRCKLIDLGEWADESRRLPGDPIPPESENSNNE